MTKAQQAKPKQLPLLLIGGLFAFAGAVMVVLGTGYGIGQIGSHCSEHGGCPYDWVIPLGGVCLVIGVPLIVAGIVEAVRRGKPASSLPEARLRTSGD
jgi:hypothetical protein